MPAANTTTSTAYGTGRRKEAASRVFLKSGSGKIIINGADLTQYFSRDTARMLVRQPLEKLDVLARFDVNATVTGGGISGQAGAIRHGISRALVAYEQQDGGDQAGPWKRALREAGYLTRDSREVERNKIGKAGAARRGKQFSKR